MFDEARRIGVGAGLVQCPQALITGGAAYSLTQIDRGLYDAAVDAAARHGRSVEEQLVYWARIGRELELAPTVSHARVARVLTGDESYDELNEISQAIVRAVWQHRVEQRLGELSAEDVLPANATTWPEADAGGRLFWRHADNAEPD